MTEQAAKKPKIVNMGTISSNDEYIKPTDHIQSGLVRIEKFKRFGSDNLFPQAVAHLNRKSNVHRSLINRKTTYITGKGFSSENEQLLEFCKNVNANNESLRKVFKKLNFDDQSNGNAYLEIVTNREKNFLNLYHHDYTTCRVGDREDKGYIVLHPYWARQSSSKEKTKRIPLYPNFEDTEGDGNLRSMIHFKGYEPEFTDYGIPEWIAGMGVSAIAYKTDKWNISRLDNNFNSSGVFLVEGEFDSEEEAEELKRDFKKEFVGEGNTGKIMFIAKNEGGDNTQFIPFSGKTDSDWSNLHIQSTNDLVIAHGWFRSLSGISDNTGFDTDRILNEYQVALETVILDKQEYFLEEIKKVIKSITGLETEDLTVINKPPVTAKPDYMRIWEARKADGLEFDPDDKEQTPFLATLRKNSKDSSN